jgi:hypothetical protein
LNEDFNAKFDYNSVPAAFSGVKANVGNQFCFRSNLPQSNNKTSWGTSDATKYSRGINATSPTTKMNLGFVQVVVVHLICTLWRSIFNRWYCN